MNKYNVLSYFNTQITAGLNEKVLFDADYRTNEKKQFGYNEAEFIKIEDLI